MSMKPTNEEVDTRPPGIPLSLDRWAQTSSEMTLLDENEKELLLDELGISASQYRACEHHWLDQLLSRSTGSNEALKAHGRRCAEIIQLGREPILARWQARAESEEIEARSDATVPPEPPVRPFESPSYLKESSQELPPLARADAQAATQNAPQPPAARHPPETPRSKAGPPNLETMPLADETIEIRTLPFESGQYRPPPAAAKPPRSNSIDPDATLLPVPNRDAPLPFLPPKKS